MRDVQHRKKAEVYKWININRVCWGLTRDRVLRMKFSSTYMPYGVRAQLQPYILRSVTIQQQTENYTMPFES